MSTLTNAQRLKLPLADFGDPERRRYPIVDASDVSDAASLLGKAAPSERDAIRKRIVAIARRKGFDIPDAWKDDRIQRGMAGLHAAMKK